MAKREQKEGKEREESGGTLWFYLQVKSPSETKCKEVGERDKEEGEEKRSIEQERLETVHPKFFPEPTRKKKVEKLRRQDGKNCR